MSHELSTPLNAVLGFAQLLRLDAARPPTVAQLERIQHIENAGAHLLALVNDVLDLSRVESGQMMVSMEPVDLEEVVIDALAMVSPLAAEAGVDLFASNPESGAVAIDDFRAGARPHSVWVFADRVRMRQVLVNLLSNAVKYNRAGGNVVVSWERGGDSGSLRITDSGLGMTSDKLAAPVRAVQSPRRREVEDRGNRHRPGPVAPPGRADGRRAEDRQHARPRHGREPAR